MEDIFAFENILKIIKIMNKRIELTKMNPNVEKLESITKLRLQNFSLVSLFLLQLRHLTWEQRRPPKTSSKSLDFLLFFIPWLILSKREIINSWLSCCLPGVNIGLILLRDENRVLGANTFAFEE